MKNMSEWQYIEEEFKRHLVDSHDSKIAHFDLADHYEERASMINKVQSFGLAIVLAWLLSSQFAGIIPQDNIIVKAVPTLLAIIVSVLSILEYVFKYKEKATTHIKYAQKYQTLWRACKNWKSDFPNEEHLEKARVAVQKYRDNLSEINREAPHLSSVLWGKIKKVQSEKGYSDPSVYNFESENNGK